MEYDSFWIHCFEAEKLLANEKVEGYIQYDGAAWKWVGKSVSRSALKKKFQRRQNAKTECGKSCVDYVWATSFLCLVECFQGQGMNSEAWDSSMFQGTLKLSEFSIACYCFCYMTFQNA